MDLATVATASTALVIVSGALFAVWRKSGRPRWEKSMRFLDRLDETINGRPATQDSWGREIAEEVPSLGDRLTSLETALNDRAELDHRVTAVEKGLVDIGRRMTSVESAHSLERIAGHIDSAQAWKAVEAIASQPGEPPPEENDE